MFVHEVPFDVEWIVTQRGHSSQRRAQPVTPEKLLGSALSVGSKYYNSGMPDSLRRKAVVEGLTKLFTKLKASLRLGHRSSGSPLPLLALAAILLLTNPWFGLIDDEAYQVGSAAQPVAIVATQFKTEAPQLHPPLPDILLHIWLALTGNSLLLLRVPSILFFTLGIWVSSRAADKAAGPSAARATIVLSVLWPYGFHFGRYAVWLPFCFFLLACVTYTYLCWLQQPTSKRLAWFVISALALLYTNFVGGAFLAVLGVDLMFRREFHWRAQWLRLASVVALLVVACAPLWPQFFRLLKIHPPAISASALLTPLYSLYVLVASESIAPWVLPLSITLALSMICCGLMILLKAPRFARVLFASTLLLVFALALSGEINQKRVMPLGAWLLISAGIALATTPPQFRRFLIVGLTVIGAISWFGIATRRFYPTSRSLEPWQQIAQVAASSVLSNQIVIGSHPVFLFYLTRDLMTAGGISPNHFRGNYAEQLQYPRVYNTAGWINAGHPTSAHMLFVDTMYGTDFRNTTAVSAWLDQHCRRENTDKLVTNPEYELKGRLFGPGEASPWRIEVRRYACSL